MDVLATSLEALIQRATNSLNEKPDVAAIEAFCTVLGKESKGVQIAGRLLAAYIQSAVEKEALQALTLLDTCMKRCGHTFHAEIGKFRFLNVMIKLVSPKYLGDKTALAVRLKIFQLLSTWVRDYPREVKIRETYEMLKKQGIIKDVPISPVIDDTEIMSKSVTKVRSPIFEDEETTKLLQELLRSKDPFDLKLANKLIKSMVKDDEKRVQLNCQRNMELESIRVNVKLLSEMLESYNSETSSTEDIELMKELYDACERLKPIVTRLAYETHDDDKTVGGIRKIGEVLAANDELTQVVEKYSLVMMPKQGFSSHLNNATTSLLDLSSPIDSIDTTSNANKKSHSTDCTLDILKSDIELLGDVFGPIENTSTIEGRYNSAFPFSDTTIMEPVGILPTSKTKESLNSSGNFDSKTRALDDLNQLGEILLKESLSQSNVISHSPKINANSFSNVIRPLLLKTTSSNAKVCSSINETPSSSSMTADFQPGINGPANITDNNEKQFDLSDLLNHEDDAMLDALCWSSIQNIDSDSQMKNEGQGKEKNENAASSMSNNIDEEIKSLTDIRVTIDSIKPGTIPPLTLMEEKNGITVVLHFAKGSPRADITVIVVTTMSKNSKPLGNYLFQVVISKHCKCRLESPSGTQLPGHNPFLPPSAITQILLIANPQKNPVSLKFMLSYTMDDETFTEMGQVDQLPMT
ncbi:ADP-ribosylation factor-binding protein GGA1 isoform X2 [Venturia canescens]|uniref:ADP-ribosylation factor-binding protein GGA1 isoform X2 n=1 Tax=Venturia canescens TaxID=32260 RepID=UPI001C9C3E54|nr:ADP-ribosylation factor-binding protein GGA1 isoform X2 [Venturia canescens]